MEPRERVLAALRGEQPDRVPVLDLVDQPVLEEVARLLGEDELDPRDRLSAGELTCRLVRRLGIDGLGTSMPSGQERVDDMHVRDRYGCVYRQSEHGEPVLLEGPISSPEALHGFDMVSRLLPEDFDCARFVRKRLGYSYPCVIWFPDTFSWSWHLRGGMQRLLVDYVKRPDLVHALAEISTRWILGVIDGLAEAGADVLVMCGDLASEVGPLFSMKHFDCYVRPYYQQIVDRAHAHGMAIVKHSDGNMWPFLDSLMQLEFDGFNPIQPQCMDIGEVKAHVGHRLCLMGNIDCRDLLVFGTDEEIRATVKQTIEIAAAGGGFILHSSNSIHPGVPGENFIAMVNAGLEYGTYQA